MKILYIGNGDEATTSGHRLAALRRLGHQVSIYDPYKEFKFHLSHPIFGKLHYRSGYSLLQNKINKWLTTNLFNENPQLVWINGGELFGSKSISILRSMGAPLILYNNDDPTGLRDGNRFRTLRSVIPQYDFIASRANKKTDFERAGAKNFIEIPMSYDEVFHAPVANAQVISEKYRSEVAFIGTWIRGERRDEFVAHLIDNGINVSVWGSRWQKAPLWKKIAPHFRGGALLGRDYAIALQGSKIALGMLSKGNRDLHTRRSVEIPYAGGLLCAERTSEHELMFSENVEAVFWSSPEECVAVCKRLLSAQLEREKIRVAGMKRVREDNYGNEDVCRRIIKTITE